MQDGNTRANNVVYVIVVTTRNPHEKKKFCKRVSSSLSLSLYIYIYIYIYIARTYHTESTRSSRGPIWRSEETVLYKNFSRTIILVRSTSKVNNMQQKGNKTIGRKTLKIHTNTHTHTHTHTHRPLVYQCMDENGMRPRPHFLRLSRWSTI